MTVVSYDLVTDAGDPNPTVTCSPASGTTFQIETTLVTCNTTDQYGNTAEPTTFNVIVVDNTGPVISPHEDVTVEATSSSGAVVSYDLPTVTDACDPNPTVTCSPASGTTFQIGTTLVTCNATDQYGNTAEPTTFNVIVQPDTTAPVTTIDSAVDGNNNNVINDGSTPSNSITFTFSTSSDYAI